MKKVNDFLITCLFLCFVSFSCKTQVQEKEESVQKEPSKEVIDAFYGSDTVLMAKYIGSGELPVGYQFEGHYSPLLTAVEENRIEVIEFLGNNLDLDLTNENIRYIIYSEWFNIDTYNSLLASISRKNKIDIHNRETGYPKYLIYGTDYTLFKLTIVYGLNLSDLIEETERRTNFYISIIKYKDWELLYLLDYNDKEGFNGNTCDGDIVLSVAVYSRNTDVVKFLLRKGLDKEARMYELCSDEPGDQLNALEFAEMLGYMDMVELLK